MALKEERGAKGRIRTLVVHPTKTLAVPEEEMVVAQIIWVVKDRLCKVVVGLWVVLVEIGVPLAGEAEEEEEVHSLREGHLVVRLGPWDQGDQEFMVDLEVEDQVGQEQGEGEDQEVGSNNRSREAGGEIERQDALASQKQIRHNLPIVISLLKQLCIGFRIK